MYLKNKKINGIIWSTLQSGTYFSWRNPIDHLQKFIRPNLD